MILPVLILAGAKTPRFPYLAREINAMTQVDQEIRKKLIDEMGAHKMSMTTLNQMREVDHRDTARMHWIVEKFGWPTPDMVGEEATGNAWLLVQHADDDKPFQRSCLALIEPLARAGVIKGVNYTYLYDRVQTGAGKLQRFGTQGQDKDGLMWIDPVEDPAKLDSYRKAYGMQPIEDYLKTLAEAYHDKVAPDWRERLKPTKPKSKAKNSK